MTQPLSGARFQREVGADPEKWAAEFLAAYAKADGVRTDADRLAFVAAWFRDAMQVAVRHAVAPRWDQQYSDADLEAVAKRAAPEWDKLNKPSQ
jgi:hypothetical protein